ncbi:leucine--tRNA ligase [Candidatus Roizmanbacteria bacterium CG22_combo_CG10-13_8_21_14_all_38_20]|uniref:Leucine--tRNA ligase n=1 Tax=Candidatus Roizmanbacteria bacterium CG22_combo_CG10-13_8_21_14_all_38_20 TaxID=1974862 RepID=A0A2H0BVG2_9BACT|nr:leucine--tRNA ligase [Candidatus Microgenomates bacterium]PIP61529.1 MAG: leucine--tRNA ligase [Candidatus Roizmanbacteria bacterium CG22_combo_CG10-13_8_21_14_all_38_20]PJC31717.1 MAG: leucine--tRNA ligase [Candidatus Roizmanbacteria bacterium CG_4_9_14_0_2_um_filter_38_17]
MKQYKHTDVEAKWRVKWDQNKTYQVDLDKAKKPFYNLMMFPYPSAEGLHVGNMYAFTGADVYGRFQRQQGYDVFEPIGLDGFGIHSENYAIKLGKHPAKLAKVSQKRFYEQLARIGNGFAWNNKLETYDPEYYKWTQWLFIQMYKKGLAYRGKAMVNWCPSCKTVLADEQVESGVCERCKNEVERKEMEQWFFKITNYADKLLENIEKIDWPNKIKSAQRQWIGRSEGLEIAWEVAKTAEKIWTFTTRPDTIYGATFIVIAPDHPILNKLNISKEAKEYKLQALKKTEQKRKATEKDKTGADTGFEAIHPITGNRIPIWIADFVLMDYGTGAIMSVPAHDERDAAFAAKFNLPTIDKLADKDEVFKLLEDKDAGVKKTNYHLRDWLISRQRYWGPPIPMVYCEKCARLPGGQGWQPVPEDQLPVLLPAVSDWEPKGDGKGPLEKAPDAWLYTKCPNCGGKAKRETDVSDTFLDSSWYFLRYPSVKKNIENPLLDVPWDEGLTKKWLPVNAYIGGAEHAVLHLLYARFVTIALHDWGMLDFEEPFPFLFSHGLIIKDGAKMSKSRGNVIVPDDYIDKYGADTLRMYLMFVGPYSQGGDFRDTSMAGMNRFLLRCWSLFTDSQKVKAKTTNKLLRKLNQTIKQMGEDIASFKYNTAIARYMELVNVWRETDQVLSKEDAISAIKIIAPLAPYVSEEIYQSLTNDEEFASVHLELWPKFDENQVKEDIITIPVQVNGKLRQTLEVSCEQSKIQSEIEKLARELPNVKKYLLSEPKKTIFVPGRLLNFVI